MNFNLDSGVLTLDMPKMWEAYLARNVLPEGISEARRYVESTKNTLNAKQYESTVGEPLPEGKIAMVIPLHFEVSDEVGQKDFLSVFAVVHVSKEVIDERDAKAEKLMERVPVIVDGKRVLLAPDHSPKCSRKEVQRPR